jgi:hypothetical protein
VDVEGVRFLNAREAEGVSVLRRSPYISGNGCSGNEGRPRKGWSEEEDGKQVGRGGVAFTSGNEHQRSELTGCSNER